MRGKRAANHDITLIARLKCHAPHKRLEGSGSGTLQSLQIRMNDDPVRANLPGLVANDRLSLMR
jgi:hypothetical protein